MIACIPTKGRKETETFKLFEASGIEVFHFIEPQQIDEYDVPNKIDIKQNDQGISYVRNFILDWARSRGEDQIIICDDDVEHFGKYQGSSVRMVNANIWHEMSKIASNLDFEMYGVSYRQRAWSEKKEYSINSSLVEVCVLLKPSKIKWKYRSEFNLKEDRDFLLQTIKYGNGVFKYNKFFYSCPEIGSNKGGLQNEYRLKKDQEALYKMINEWKPFLKIKKAKHGVDAKYDLKSFCKYHKKLCK